MDQGAQRIPETYYMLKQGFKGQSPKIVMLETNTLFRDIGAVKSTQAILEQMGQYYLPVFRYHNLWKTAVDEPKIHTNYKGFVIRDEVAPYEGKPDYMKKKKKCETMPKYVKIYLEKIEELCEKNNAQLLLVSMPSPKNWNHKRHAEMQQYADEKGIAYLDLNEKVEELGLNWAEDTQDKGDHLNVYGAEKVTSYLGNYLEDNYELEDHRNDPAYEAWNQLAEQYEQKSCKDTRRNRSDKRNRCRKMIAKEKLNILWSLEQTAEKYADRVAVSDVNQELTWKELVKKAQVIGAELSEKVQPGNPVPVLLEKSSETLAVMLGIVYAGCFYVPVNPMNPTERLRKIMEKLDPEVIISDEKGKEQLAAVGNGLENKVMGPEALKTATGTELSEEQYSRLEQIQGQWKETDVLYGIFTSGSTGTPKAIVVSHGAASRFIRHFYRNL